MQAADTSQQPVSPTSMLRGWSHSMAAGSASHTADDFVSWPDLSADLHLHAAQPAGLTLQASFPAWLLLWHSARMHCMPAPESAEAVAATEDT